MSLAVSSVFSADMYSDIILYPMDKLAGLHMAATYCMSKLPDAVFSNNFFVYLSTQFRLTNYNNFYINSSYYLVYSPSSSTTVVSGFG